MENSERFTWAAEIMNIQPSQHILEIGCGVGLAVARILPLLGTGTITAIDRSETAIAKAIKRNAAGMESNKALFKVAELLQVPTSGKKYDRIFSFNVNLFWTQQSVHYEAAVLKALLKKDAAIYIFYGPMLPGGFEKIAAPLAANLERENFTVAKALHHKALNCCCFIAQP